MTAVRSQSMFSTIRVKTLLIVSLTLLGLVLSIYALSSRILNANLETLETRDTVESVERVTDAISQRLDTMDATARSWSQWDDTMRYLKDRNSAYFQENLTPETITTMKSNVIVLMDAKGKIVFGTNHDLVKQANASLDSEVRALLTPGSALLKHKSPRSRHAGWLLSPRNILLVVTRPIVNNNGTGAIHGTLLLGVYLTDAETSKLSALTHQKISLTRLTEIATAAMRQLPMESDPRKMGSHWAGASGAVAEIPPAQSPQLGKGSGQYMHVNPGTPPNGGASVLGGNGVAVQAQNANVITGSADLKDVFGTPALRLRVDVPRDIYQQGQLGIRSILGALLLSGSIFGILTLLLLEKLVLSRVTRLAGEVAAVRMEGDGAPAVTVVGRDELSDLAEKINAMVSALHASVQHDKETREEIESSLREKDVLLKEVYHRVKNNLQIISSLLNLQSDSIEDPAIRELFDESRNRVKSMALVHEKLYQSDDLGRIEFGSYLDNLATALLRSYNNRNGRISLELDTDETLLSIDMAVPCGLIVNELVTNSLKYAFPGDRTGSICLRLHTQEDGRIAMVVSDDGVGVPEGFSIEEAESIGMQLVVGLTEQLEGTCDLSRDEGTRWTICFKGG